MASNVDSDRVAAVVAEVLGETVSDVRVIAGSVANQDFAVDLAAGGRVVLKAAPPGELAAEAWACRRLTALGVPVPPVAALDLDARRLGRPFVILTFVEGEPSDEDGVAREAGRWFRQVHAVGLPGWGPVEVDSSPAGPQARGRFSSWREVVEAGLAGLPELVAAGVVDEGLASTARALVGVGTVLGYAGPGVLLHHDLKPAHLFGVGEAGRRRLSAVIDWGDATVGDPAADLARLSMSGPDLTAAFLDGYGVDATDELADRLARYRILWNVRALHYEFRAGGDWFDAYRLGIAADVDRLT